MPPEMPNDPSAPKVPGSSLDAEQKEGREKELLDEAKRKTEEVLRIARFLETGARYAPDDNGEIILKLTPKQIEEEKERKWREDFPEEAKREGIKKIKERNSKFLSELEAAEVTLGRTGQFTTFLKENENALASKGIFLFIDINELGRRKEFKEVFGGYIERRTGGRIRIQARETNIMNPTLTTSSGLSSVQNAGGELIGYLDIGFPDETVYPNTNRDAKVFFRELKNKLKDH